MRYLFLVFAVMAAIPALAQSSAASVTRLTDPQDDYPDISPDGRTILFQSNRSGSWQLWRMNSDGTGLERLLNRRSNDRQPSWSPDGQTIAFSSDAGQAAGMRAIFLIAADDPAAPARQLSLGMGQDVHPKWLRDGSGLVFNRIAADGKTADVLVVTLDRRERKVELAPGMNTYASMDASGRRMVYRGTTAETGSNGPFENSDIFTANADGTGRRRLTSDPAFDGWPAISPDGTRIAFASRQGGREKFGLFTMPIDGGAPTEIRTPPGFHYTQPAWSPDGRSLVVYRWNADAAGETGQLVRVPLP